MILNKRAIEYDERKGFFNILKLVFGYDSY
uniref:Uncharacterized protein n=1 Tax=Myoviridae sp. ctsip2 TaxID=2826705 RepID=A0A8S5N5F9_9CAUD|nr:MAG TPA: hypothetical protein [Myoviridae sp. ctsip2]DAV00872.1 MAG TPA: hypothetical protein [Caudoviricetes sp.]